MANELIRRGGKSEYHDGLPEQMLHYFREAPQSVTGPVMIKIEESPLRGLVKTQEVRNSCSDMPTFQRFGASLGVTTMTLLNWAAKYLEFGEAYQVCKEIQEDFMVQGMLSGRIPPASGIFIAKNLTKFRDDSQVTVKQETVSKERPKFAEKTPQQLEKLKAALEAAGELGVKLEIAEEPVRAAAGDGERTEG